MTKAQLASNIASKVGGDASKIKEIIDLFTQEVSDSLKRNEVVYIRGFGSFNPVVRKAKLGRNIKKGERVYIPSKVVAKFKPSDLLLNKLQ